MTPERYQRVKEVFLAVCERPEDQQDAQVVALCENDPELKGEVASLLESHRKAVHVNATEWFDQTSVRTQPDPPTGDPVRSTKTAQPDEDDRSPSTQRTRTGSGGRFHSGQVLCERYRIVSLLGAGGMGEVYRADDLTLDQPVALKFLPKNVASDPQWLERFHNEVRLSRQVAHANVCRVFDIGQIEGDQFITMEFIDGEDLASLLRRIGRLPRDKAVQISRQICAGLAAAHDRGVLHRDLKPANIMLDGRGQVRITDFGISSRVDGQPSASAGTPAYMAPEQFTRGEATVRSDIYALGLVLYEIFTGKPAFTAGSMPEYARLHRQSSPTHPSTFVADMDPLVERVIYRCMEKDPTKRPTSGLAVAAALPGGDPLAAALAAGETPSPEMVAAAGADQGFNVVRASILLVTTLVGLAACVMLSPRAMLLPRMPLTKAPAVLSDKAHQVLTDIGLTQNPRSRAQGFWLDPQYVSWLQRSENTRLRWDTTAWARSGAVLFWYRESPDYMVSRDEMGMVTLDEPSRSAPGMHTVLLDAQGGLRRLEIMPGDPPSPSPGDFSSLFHDAGLDMQNFTPITADSVKFTPPMFADHRAAWTGHMPDDPDHSVEIDAASLNGQPVFFQIVEPWKVQALQEGIEEQSDMPTNTIVVQFLLLCVAIASAIVLAWKNLRAGRGDAAGAQKLSAAFLFLGIVIWLLMASHVPEIFLEMRMLFRVAGFILVPAAVVWMFYLALDPYVRRIWPETIISWSRLLSGRLKDRLVAGHVLIGIAVAVGATLLGELGNLIPAYFGHAAAIPLLGYPMRFLGKENPAAVCVWALLMALYVGLLYLLSLVLFQLVFRRRWLASSAFVLLIPLNAIQWTDTGWMQWVQAAIVTGLFLLLMVRYGLVATISALWAIYIMRYIPITSDPGAWYWRQTQFAIVTLAATTIIAATITTRNWNPPVPHLVPLESEGKKGD
jgi:serine/threonine-protein kinase